MVGAALIAFGLAWNAGSSHAQTPYTTPSTSAGGTSTPSMSGSSTPSSSLGTPTTAASPLTPVRTPTGAVAGAQSLPGTGTGSGGDSGPASVLWIGLTVLGAGLVGTALALTAKRRRSPGS